VIVATKKELVMKPFSIILIAVALLLAGCATAPTETTANNTVDITRYRAVNVAPIQFAANAAHALSDADRESLQSDLHTALRDGLTPALTTDDRTADVVRIEVTVTGLNASNPAVNLLTAALVFLPLDAGGITFEARFYEGDSTEPFANIDFQHTSTPLEIRGSFSRYGHAKKALHDWAEQLASGSVRLASAAH
jgi:uncharacterized lipoprotein YmbA